MSLPDLQDIAARSHSLQGIGYFTFQIPTLGGGSSEPKITPEITANTNLFNLIGVTPMMGADLFRMTAKPGRNNVLVLGYKVWQESFHGNRGIVGSKVTIDGDPYSVIGVLPPDVEFPGNVGDAIYSPLVTDDKSHAGPGQLRTDAFWTDVAGGSRGAGAGRAEWDSAAVKTRTSQRGRQRSHPGCELSRFTDR